jgi:hypothetical protein
MISSNEKLINLKFDKRSAGVKWGDFQIDNYIFFRIIAKHTMESSDFSPNSKRWWGKIARKILVFYGVLLECHRYN